MYLSCAVYVGKESMLVYFVWSISDTCSYAVIRKCIVGISCMVLFDGVEATNKWEREDLTFGTYIEEWILEFLIERRGPRVVMRNTLFCVFFSTGEGRL